MEERQIRRHRELTEREKQIARLAAGGNTARAIGASLGITRRTVETHLAKAYAKLGVRSRGELRSAGFAPEA